MSDGGESFDLKGKIALVTGGASGIGFACARELLKKGVKGVALVDIKRDNGNKAAQQLVTEHGEGKATFFKADVSKIHELESAFLDTIRKYNHIDIVVNNAGIFNDKYYDEEIRVNVGGCVNGIVLAMQSYLPRYKTGHEAVIINTASIAGLNGYNFLPIYSGTKHAIIGLTRSFGEQYHYNKYKVKVVSICPGLTDAPLLATWGNFLDDQLFKEYLDEWKRNNVTPEKAEYVAEVMVKLIEKGKTGDVWVTENGKTYQYVFPELKTMEENKCF